MLTPPIRPSNRLNRSQPPTMNIFSILIAFIVVGLVFYLLQNEIDRSGMLDNEMGISTSGNGSGSSTYTLSEYRSLLSILLLVTIVVVLLVLAATWLPGGLNSSSSDHLNPRNQIFFNLIQLNIDNLGEGGNGGSSTPDGNDSVTSSEGLPEGYDANPPEYSTVVMIEPDEDLVEVKSLESEKEELQEKQEVEKVVVLGGRRRSSAAVVVVTTSTSSSNSSLNSTSSNAELPPSYDVALSRWKFFARNSRRCSNRNSPQERPLRVTHSERCINFCVHEKHEN